MARLAKMAKITNDAKVVHFARIAKCKNGQNGHL